MADELIVSGYQNVSFNIGNFSDFLNLANASGVGWTFTTICYLIFFIMLITLTGTFGFEAGILTAAFVGFIIGLFFVYAGVMAWYMDAIFVGIIIVMIIYLIGKQNG